jgi:hypothetical protein
VLGRLKVGDFMSVVARLEPSPDNVEDRRRAPRMRLRLGAAVGPAGSSALIHDISTKGLLLETTADIANDRVEVHLPHLAAAQARVVWSHGRFFGCEFSEPIPSAAVSAALLRSDPRLRPGQVEELPGAVSEREPGELAPRSARHPLATWLKAIAALAVVSAGAAYLIASGHIVLLATIAVAVGGLAAVLTLVAIWGMDQAFYL